MIILHLSDSHSFHRQLEYEKVDIVIHSGDSTNKRNWVENQPEFEDFLEWYISYPVKHKILIAGNHDAWATKKYNVERIKKETDIIYLDHEYIEINGKLIFGSPYTPPFGDWHFMRGRNKLDKLWATALVDKIDILVTHGPPQTILDLSRDLQNKLEYCGDKSLYNHILRTNPKYSCYGHIHDSKNCRNYGTRTIDGIDTIFINSSLVEDGRYDKGLIHTGHKFEL